MDRRDFLKKASASGMGLALSGTLARAKVPNAQAPNILFILVDELRFPTVFPTGVEDASQFLWKFMPNTHKLWQKGVKFGKHFTAGSACTPSRGILMTGLYTQQTWMMQTLTNGPKTKVSIPPVLDPVFPTYGRLLRQAGYDTPYIGKWHLSLAREKAELQQYGYDGMTLPDPTGANLQGSVGDPADGFLSDADIAAQATQWLSTRKPGSAPWCCTVSFQNPHDHEFFWAGTEFKTYNDLFDSQTTYQPFTYYSRNDGTNYPPVVAWDQNVLKNPPSYGYPALPPNWESAARVAAHKPSTQSFARTFIDFVWGGVSDDPNQDKFTIVPYPGLDGYGVAMAPHSYWQRSLDSYTQVLSLVDEQIGAVVGALPPGVADNTVIVLTSDHGDYVGAHGLAANKVCTGYDEAYHVPLIVVDPTERFTGDIHMVRQELTSSVDLMAMLVTLGHNGSQDWQTGQLKRIYGGRHNMMPMLRSASAPGRDYVLLVTDEMTLSNYVYNDAPLHITGLRTQSEKVVTYAKWRTLTSRIEPRSLELEFYDYSTERGRAELHNEPGDPRAKALADTLHTKIVPLELHAPLPGAYGIAQAQAKLRYLEFARLIEHPPQGDRSPKILKKWLGFGGDA
jgi:arylsulfatase A-like enzyme